MLELYKKQKKTKTKKTKHSPCMFSLQWCLRWFEWEWLPNAHIFSHQGVELLRGSGGMALLEEVLTGVGFDGSNAKTKPIPILLSLSLSLFLPLPLPLSSLSLPACGSRCKVFSYSSSICLPARCHAPYHNDNDLTLWNCKLTPS